MWKKSVNLSEFLLSTFIKGVVDCSYSSLYVPWSQNYYSVRPSQDLTYASPYLIRSFSYPTVMVLNVSKVSVSYRHPVSALLWILVFQCIWSFVVCTVITSRYRRFHVVYRRFDRNELSGTFFLPFSNSSRLQISPLLLTNTLYRFLSCTGFLCPYYFSLEKFSSGSNR